MSDENHSETWKQFYWQWIETIFERPWSIAEKVATVLALGLPLLAWLATKWHRLPALPEPIINSLLWQVPVGMLIVLSLIRIVPAPYWIYKKRHTAALESERKLNKKLKTQSDASLKNEWKDLGARFATLPNHIRVDWQCDRKNNQTVYENWRFAGDTNTPVETLCRYAGKLLLKSHSMTQQLPEYITQQADPAWTWLFFLKDCRKAFSQQSGYGQSEDGTIILLGSIYHIGASSQNACLDCEVSEF
jgi:hypothetical protein